MTPARRDAAVSADVWRVAVLLFAVSFGTNVSTPLLVVYRRRLSLGPTSVTSIFAVYAVGLMLTLLFAGAASDRLGRRWIVLPFSALAVVTSLMFVPAANAAPLLYVARFLQGVVSGAVFSVGSAWLAETSAHAPAAVSARRASIALNGGFSLGPLTAGLLGQWAPAPTTLPFVVHVALTVTGLVLAWRIPETVVHRRPGPLVRLRLPPGRRRAFWAVLVPTAITVFAFPAVASTVLPFLLVRGTPAVAVTGLIAGLTLGTAALVAPAARPLGRAAAPVGLSFGTVGLGLAVLATHVHAWLLLMPVAALLGAASGLTMTAGLTLAERISTEETRGAVYALFYAFVYVGFGAPVVVTLTSGPAPAVPFAVMAGVTAAVGAWLYAVGRRPAAFSSALSGANPSA